MPTPAATDPFSAAAAEARARAQPSIERVRPMAPSQVNENWQPVVRSEPWNTTPHTVLGYTNNLTVLNAVATAEGFSYRANTRVVYIKRADSSGEQAFPLTTATQVAPGDTIRIGERFF